MILHYVRYDAMHQQVAVLKILLLELEYTITYLIPVLYCKLDRWVRMQHLVQNKEDLVDPVYLFRFASKEKSAVFIFLILMTKSNM
jgi:hypothetical protein